MTRGVDPPKPMGRRKTTEAQRAQIVETYNKGATCAELAEIHHISNNTVLNILKAAGVARRRRNRRVREYTTWREQ